MKRSSLLASVHLLRVLPVVVVLGLQVHPAWCSDQPEGGRDARPESLADSVIVLESKLTELGTVQAEARIGLLGIARSQLELARASDDPIERCQAMRDVSLLFLRAAIPARNTGRDDALRRDPGAGWTEYVGLAWEGVQCFGGGINDPEAVQALVPPIDRFDAGPLYSPAYYEQALELWRTATSTTVRLMAAAYVVKHSALIDWKLACDVANEAAALEAAHTPRNRQEIDFSQRSMEQLYAALRDHLRAMDMALRRAIREYVRQTGTCPKEELLRGGGQLWSLLHPYIEEGMASASWTPGWNPAWMDLDSNPFLTTPGLRITGVELGADNELKQFPSIATYLVFWEPIDERLPTPWTERYRERAERLGVAEPARSAETPGTRLHK